MRTFLALLAALALVAACGNDDADVNTGSDGAATPGSLDGRTFLSESVTENGAPRALVDGTQIRLSFVDGNVGASAGCNSLGGAYEFDGDALVVTELSQTEMGCDGPRHDQDAFLASVLTDRPTIVLDGDDLTLTTASASIVLVDRVVADPDRELVGPTWIVTGFVDGDVASAFADDGAPGTIRFPDVSSFEWFDGCNSGTGNAEVSDGSTGGPVDGDGEIQWGETQGTTKACPDRVEYTAAFGRLFATGAASYEITASNLTITNGDGAGVTFRAETE